MYVLVTKGADESLTCEMIPTLLLAFRQFFDIPYTGYFHAIIVSRISQIILWIIALIIGDS